MNKFLLATAIFIAAPAATMAADLGVLTSPTPVAYNAPSFSWTGFYAGANIGWGTSNFDTATGDIDVNGILGGVQAGYNYDFGGFVLGLEADAQLANLRESETVLGVNFDYGFDSFGTIRARAGLAVDRFLPYITGGLAWANGSVDASLGGVSISSDNTFWGWTVGGGVEFAATDNVTVKAEYLYADFDTETFFGGTVAAFNTDATTHVIRAGVNYKF